MMHCGILSVASREKSCLVENRIEARSKSFKRSMFCVSNHSNELEQSQIVFPIYNGFGT